MDEVDKRVETLTKKIKQKEDLILAKIEDPVSKEIIKFSIKNNSTFYRARTLFTKEPETIDWIRKFKKNSVFYDIGANVGVFSLFAALITKSKTFSFDACVADALSNLILTNEEILSSNSCLGILTTLFASFII